ncbi:MAG: hypothetical protein K6G33_03570 [Ruminococcus sp.]|uniref:hypothetical protein n=1 Tax=Ruminococcus sp. TaxID=41978 RepID=UPI0025D4239A|nr:hypothetical protein [Ruminococcus sp.]MCR5599810.1 hypothetical protein [Ruminococcus sp.]
MKRHEDDMMNYDENGYYTDEKPQTDNNSSSLIKKIIGILVVLYFFATIFYMFRLSQTEGNDYKIIISFVQLFAVFGILGLISSAVKKHKLDIACLVMTVISISAILAIFAYRNGSDDIKKVLIKIGLCLFFMIFIVIGIVVIIADFRGSKGNAERCTIFVTATCVDVSTSTTRVNGRITKIYYNPTYEYTYEGETYKSYINNINEIREKNMNYDIMIDPDDPKVIYEPARVNSHFFAIIFGLMFVAMPLAMMITMLIII